MTGREVTQTPLTSNGWRTIQRNKNTEIWCCSEHSSISAKWSHSGNRTAMNHGQTGRDLRVNDGPGERGTRQVKESSRWSHQQCE